MPLKFCSFPERRKAFWQIKESGKIFFKCLTFSILAYNYHQVYRTTTSRHTVETPVRVRRLFSLQGKRKRNIYPSKRNFFASKRKSNFSPYFASKCNIYIEVKQKRNQPKQLKIIARGSEKRQSEKIKWCDDVSPTAAVLPLDVSVL